MTVSQRVVFKTVLTVWKCVDGAAPLQPTSATSAYLPRPRLVERSCALRPVERIWGLRADSEVPPSTDRPAGTVCRLHYEHQSCHRTLSQRALKTHYCSRPSGTVETFLRDFSAEYKYTDLLTYLLNYLYEATQLRESRDYWR